ncbi:hypothetical protein [Bacillus niameyensis]|uniref:hypothetical protein n=1 Tax=Bacillus niameyensis TaxID=1522308 RepID=UPI000781F8CB|nr:hypothetical protein [Bacillus niameyensis]
MNFVAWMIIAAEIGFWIVILLGFVTRYLLKREKLGFFFLTLTPVIDLILLATTSIDLYNGATATSAHGIAAIYIGVSLAFGKSMIRWADERFRYYIVKQGPKPLKLYGMDYARHYFKSWGQHVLAYVIGSFFLLGLIFLIKDAPRTEVLDGFWKLWSLILGIDFLIALSNFIWPKRAKA